MKGIVYEVTGTDVLGLAPVFHEKYKRGYAYETTTHFVHYYAYDYGWNSLQINLCVTEPKNGTLEDWVKKHFEATNIHTVDYEVGETIEGVWRPGLYYYEHIYQALNTCESERRLNEQALRVLLEKLDDIFLYIEPDATSFKTYSHKLRELLILACTEVESSWVYFLDKAGVSPVNRSSFTTKDYIRLKDVLFLEEYECTFKGHTSIPAIQPFKGWDDTSPTKSLSWYDAYNKTKHNRVLNFSEANMYNVIQAVIASIIMYIVRYSPFPMQEESGTFNSLINQHFKFRLVDSDVKKHYIPLIEIPAPFRPDIISYSPFKNGHVKPYVVKPFIL
ncbi:hypothetical protein OCK74_08805 [Chitinophagaceae bacterium LB-8]|uniref:Uncharacterized protein n=1 Tax=Paraflavisolibacter caeni TaxID=2982496 RepID=A0A9X2XWZ0_9BACT|nr:hypothetical protein [Paraflavisolibacter caeni]MCU7549213.1 hypothetical protein [Paraflavisolibacter caeni]